MSRASGPAHAGDDEQEVFGMSDLGFGPGPDWAVTEAEVPTADASSARAGSGGDGSSGPGSEEGGRSAEPAGGKEQAPGKEQEPEAAEAAPVDGAAAPEVEASSDEGQAPGEQAELQDELTQLRRERDEYLRMLQQVQADFENYRKRVLRQSADAAARASEGLIERLLPVLDTVELARAHAVDSAVEQVAAALFELLEKEGLERVRPVPGAPFDPTDQEAVSHEPGDGQPEVVEVLRDGYRYRGRMLRAALVKVKG